MKRWLYVRVAGCRLHIGTVAVFLAMVLRAFVFGESLAQKQRGQPVFDDPVFSTFPR